MQNLKFFTSLVIPGLMLLSAFVFVALVGQNIRLYCVIKILKEQSGLLPYLSLSAVAIAYVIGAASNRIIVRFLAFGEKSENGKRDSNFDKAAVIYQYGEAQLIRALETTQSVMILFRLLFGAVPLFCLGLLGWINTWQLILFVPGFVVLILYLPACFVVGRSIENKKFRNSLHQVFLRHKIGISAVVIIILSCCAVSIIWINWPFDSSFLSWTLLILLILSPPLFFCLHSLTRGDHDNSREAFLKVCRDKAKI